MTQILSPPTEADEEACTRIVRTFYATSTGATNIIVYSALTYLVADFLVQMFANCSDHKALFTAVSDIHECMLKIRAADAKEKGPSSAKH